MGINLHNLSAMGARWLFGRGNPAIYLSTFLAMRCFRREIRSAVAIGYGLGDFCIIAWCIVGWASLIELTLILINEIVFVVYQNILSVCFDEFALITYFSQSVDLQV